MAFPTVAPRSASSPGFGERARAAIAKLSEPDLPPVTLSGGAALLGEHWDDSLAEADRGGRVDLTPTSAVKCAPEVPPR